MSRKNKYLRAFLHQNQNPTIEQAWDAAWKHAQKTFHARSMQDMEEKLAAAQAENEKLVSYTQNGIECFASPCPDHSGVNTPPFSEFQERYGRLCLMCVVDELDALKAGLRAHPHNGEQPSKWRRTLERIARYPRTRSEELSAPGMREMAREALSDLYPHLHESAHHNGEQGGEWVRCDERLPAPERSVLATFVNANGKRRTICGHYIPRFTVVSDGDLDTHDEYHEEKDEYYLCEGWYENIENWGEFSAVHVCEGEITHWMPIPQPPKSKEDRGHE